MPFRSLSDKSLLYRIQRLTRRERAITLLVLLHLNEIERRRLHLKLGYSSMFDYCTSGLGYSASAASRRIRTARCVARYPEIRALLRTNEVNVSTVAQVSRVLSVESKDAILARIRGKSQREVESIVAEFEPRASMPRDRAHTIVVRVPAPASPLIGSACAEDRPEVSSRTLTAPEELSLVGSHDAKGFRVGSHEGTVSPVDSHDRSGCKSGAQATLLRRTILQFSASDAFMAKLETVRSLAWHRLPANASLEDVFELALDLMIEKDHPSQRRARRERAAAYRKRAKENSHAEPQGELRQATVSARPKQPTSKKESQLERRDGDRVTKAVEVDDIRPRRSEIRNRTTVTNARYVAPAARDRVHVRDQGQCTFKGPDGRRCASTRGLQIDHVRPVALGGDGQDENLRLLCAYHNRLEAERLLGSAYRRAGPSRG